MGIWLNGKELITAGTVTSEDYIASGTGTPGSVDKIGGDLYITDDLEVDGASYFGGSIVVGNNVEIGGSSTGTYGGIYPARTSQTNASIIYFTGSASRAMIICDASDTGTDFGHAQQANPTIIIHSLDETDTSQWISFAHNQTNGVIQTGKGNLTIGSGSTSNTLNTPNDLFVSGKLEADGILYADAGIAVTTSGTLDMGSRRSIILGGTTNDFTLHGDRTTVQAVLTVGSQLGRHLVIHDAVTFHDFDHAAQTNPTVFVHSAEDPDTDNTQWISIHHDQTNGNIATGKGNLDLKPATGITNVCGAGLLTKESSETVVDDATISLPDATSGTLEVSSEANTTPSVGWFYVQTDGTVTLISSGGSVAATDSDGDLCCYQSGTQAIIKNRLGDSGTVRYSYKYSA